MQLIQSMRKFFRMFEPWKMGTMRWTSTYESGFECLQPVRLTVSPSHRRRSLVVVCWLLFVVVCFFLVFFCFVFLG